MKKKILAALLAAAMLASLTACGKPETPDNTDSSVSGENAESGAPTVEEGTMGAAVWDEFAAALKENPNASPEELAALLAESKAVGLSCIAGPVDPTWMPGFLEGFVPEGFAEGATFAPMIGSIPFIGYVFSMEEGADIAGFVKDLKDHADPRWNICVEADQIVAGSVGNTVLFVMCPNSMESDIPMDEETETSTEEETSSEEASSEETSSEAASSEEESSKEESSKPASSKEESSKPASSKEESSKPASSKEESSKPASSKEESSKPASDDSASKEPADVKIIAPSAAKGTMGADVWNAFVHAAKADPSASAESLANQVSGSSKIPFNCIAAPVDPTWMQGFNDGFLPSGFAEGAAFSPMIGSIPFIGYVFNLDEGADVAGFVNSLHANANPRWNICVEADQVVAGAVGNTVFFLMCPISAD